MGPASGHALGRGARCWLPRSAHDGDKLRPANGPVRPSRCDVSSPEPTSSGRTSTGVEEETQGYVDAIGLYCGVSAWAQERAVKRRFGDIPGEPSAPSQWLVNWPAFGELTDEAQSLAAGFARNNETWAKATFQDSDLLDGKVFMARLVSRVEDSPTTAAYRRGVRTARRHAGRVRQRPDLSSGPAFRVTKARWRHKGNVEALGTPLPIKPKARALQPAPAPRYLRPALRLRACPRTRTSRT